MEAKMNCRGYIFKLKLLFLAYMYGIRHSFLYFSCALHSLNGLVLWFEEGIEQWCCMNKKKKLDNHVCEKKI